MRRVWIGLALALMTLSGGCVPRTVLHTRPDPAALTASSAARVDQVRRVEALLDELQIMGEWYRFESNKNHDKRRWFAVWGTTSAFAAAGTVPVLLSPEVDESAKTVVVAIAASTAIAGGVLHILPFAHEYDQKQACYRDAALRGEERYAALAARCHEAIVSEDDATALGSCERALITALEELARFDEATPCTPPRPAELEQLKKRAVRPDEAPK